MPLTIHTAADVPFSIITDAFNRGYEGYVMPVNLSEEQLRGHVEHNQGDLALSRVAFDGEEPAGIILVARRGARAWIGGVGVATSYRKQGIGRRLMQEGLSAARETGITDVQLEVITTNTAAHNLYLSLGFTDTRRLLIVERQPTPMQAEGSYTYGEIPVEEAVTHAESFHTTPKPWQRQADSIRSNAQNLAARAVRRGDTVAAVAIMIVSGRGVGLIDLAASGGNSDALRALVTNLHAEFPLASARFVNVAEDDPAASVLMALDYHETMAQHEMHVPV